MDLRTETLAYWHEWDPISAIQLRRLAGASRQPVVHAHTGHTAALASLAGLGGRFPTVAHRRVDFNLSSGLSRSLKYDRAGRVVAVSRAIAGLLEKDGLAPSKVVVVPDSLPVGAEEAAWAGQPAALFSPPPAAEKAALRKALASEFNLDASVPWIGNLAALVPHKDHDTLLASALIVLLKRPKALFLIAGEGPEEERLMASIKRMGLLGRVLLLGHRKDPLPLLKSLDLFVLSSWGEGMGSVLLEAAACGVPRVATTAGGIPELIEDKLTGRLVPPRAPEPLASAIIALLDDKALGSRLCAKALESLPRFGLKRMAKQMEEVYAGLA